MTGMADHQEKEPWYLFLEGGSLMLRQRPDGGLEVPDSCPMELNDLAGKAHEVTMHDGRRLKALQTSLDAPLAGFQGVGLRKSFHVLPLQSYLEAGKASQILFWDKMSRFCPRCGVPTEQKTPIMKQCPSCHTEYYPPIYAAIIVLIERDDKILLVRSRTLNRAYYGLVAGFLEAGESLEQCLRREVMEETGLSVTDVRYFSSQPWPYPSGLMVGFTAKSPQGEIQFRDGELTEAGFFGVDDLPPIPEKMSMARMLIDDWILRQKGKK